MKNKLVIGTANFGKKYGLSNYGLSEKKSNDVLKYLIKKNILNLDTAQVYGKSENIIGNYDSNNKFKLISKFKLLKDGNIENIIMRSFQKLKKNKIDGLLYHDFEDLINFPSSLNYLIKLKEKSKINKIGFSLYFPSQLEYLIKNDIYFNLIQVPYNLFDRRFEKYFQYLKNNNIEIHVRSIFLQGLFFKDKNNIPSKLMDILPHIIKLNKLSHDNKLSILESAIYFVFKNKFINMVVVGIDSIRNIKQILNILNLNTKIEIDKVFKNIGVKDEKLILPINW